MTEAQSDQLWEDFFDRVEEGRYDEYLSDAFNIIRDRQIEARNVKARKNARKLAQGVVVKVSEENNLRGGDVFAGQTIGTVFKVNKTRAVVEMNGEVGEYMKGVHVTWPMSEIEPA